MCRSAWHDGALTHKGAKVPKKNCGTYNNRGRFCGNPRVCVVNFSQFQTQNIPHESIPARKSPSQCRGPQSVGEGPWSKEKSQKAPYPNSWSLEEVVSKFPEWRGGNELKVHKVHNLFTPLEAIWPTEVNLGVKRKILERGTILGVGSKHGGKHA